MGKLLKLPLSGRNQFFVIKHNNIRYTLSNADIKTGDDVYWFLIHVKPSLGSFVTKFKSPYDGDLAFFKEKTVFDIFPSDVLKVTGVTYNYNTGEIKAETQQVRNTIEVIDIRGLFKIVKQEKIEEVNYYGIKT